MGKLLLIFDGFDEMAARVDKQQMINNFWELAKVVVPGSKVILTCRTEHFPEAREGRSLLNAELQASTKGLSGETPQFEVLELEKFEDEQIRSVLLLQSSAATVEQVMGNAQLLDLARRPVMTELILEALPDIEAGKPVDMSRVYLYAVRRKMERDIKAERTFTSMADKLYFLCELSWEMLSTDRMSINYREFPDRIRKLFGSSVQEEKDLDHWHYDMMGQTMLIRNADGDYSPAHRSLLEFFVAFKFAAELGALAPDFLELAQMKSGIDRSLEPREYTWSEYFGGGAVAPLKGFVTESLEKLRSGFGKEILPKAVIELLVLVIHKPESLTLTIQSTRGLSRDKVRFINGNIITTLGKRNRKAIAQQDFSRIAIQGANFEKNILQSSNFSQSFFADCQFTKILGKLSTVTFSPDGELMATGDSSNVIRIWNIKKNQEICTLEGHSSWVYSVAFSPDGRQLVSGSYDNQIRVWSLLENKCIRVLTGHTDWVRSVTFSPDGSYIASASNELLLWDASSGQLIKQLKGHTSWVYSVAFDPESEKLVSGSYDQTVKLWNILSGDCLMTFLGHQSSVQSVNFSPSGTTIASSGDILKLWDVKTGNCLHSLKGHEQGIWATSFSPEGDMIVSASADQTIKVWDVETGICLHTLQGHSDRVYSVDFHPFNRTIVSASHDSTVCIWSSETGELLSLIEGHSDAIISLNFSSDGKYLALGCSDKSIKVLEWNSYNEQAPFNLIRVYEDSRLGGWYQSVTFLPNKSFFVSGGIGIGFWDISKLDCTKVILGAHNLTLWIDFNSTGSLMASCGDDEKIKIWNVETGECLRTIKSHLNRVWKVLFTSDDDFLVSCSSDETIKVWRVDSGECVSTHLGHQKRIYSLDTHPKYNIFASGGDDRLLRVWDINSPECTLLLSGHQDAILTVRFSYDGRLIATGSGDYTVRIWDSQTGECLHVLSSHTSPVNELAFHPGNNVLVSGSVGGSLKVWNIFTGECLSTFRNRPYEGMNITGVKGLSAAEIATLKALGAVEESVKEEG